MELMISVPSSFLVVEINAFPARRPLTTTFRHSAASCSKSKCACASPFFMWTNSSWTISRGFALAPFGVTERSRIVSGVPQKSCGCFTNFGRDRPLPARDNHFSLKRYLTCGLRTNPVKQPAHVVVVPVFISNPSCRILQSEIRARY